MKLELSPMSLSNKLSSVDYVIESMTLDDGYIVMRINDGEERREMRINVEEFI